MFSSGFLKCFWDRLWCVRENSNQKDKNIKIIIIINKTSVPTRSTSTSRHTRLCALSTHQSWRFKALAPGMSRCYSTLRSLSSLLRFFFGKIWGSFQGVFGAIWGVPGRHFEVIWEGLRQETYQRLTPENDRSIVKTIKNKYFLDYWPTWVYSQVSRPYQLLRLLQVPLWMQMVGLRPVPVSSNNEKQRIYIP